MPPEDQRRHDAANGRLTGYLLQLRVAQRDENYPRTAAAVYREIARLATSEAKSLEEST